MRIVFVGAGEFTAVAVRDLIERGHEVIVVESRRERIEELSDAIDCSFVHGDGTRPAILREVGPGKADVLVCATDDDRTNVLASVVGRHVGFSRVVTTVEDLELEEICRELGFEDVVVPGRSVGRVLRDVALGVPGADPERALRHGAHLFTFTVGGGLAGSDPGALELPSGARAVWLHRADRFVPIDPEVRLEQDDEVVVLAHEEDAGWLARRYGKEAPPAAAPET